MREVRRRCQGVWQLAFLIDTVVPTTNLYRNLRIFATTQVKVQSVLGNKIKLSMKEVDQVTGEDLKPMAFSSGANMEPVGGAARNPEKCVGRVSFVSFASVLARAFFHAFSPLCRMPQVGRAFFHAFFAPRA